MYLAFGPMSGWTGFRFCLRLGLARIWCKADSAHSAVIVLASDAEAASLIWVERGYKSGVSQAQQPNEK